MESPKGEKHPSQISRTESQTVSSLCIHGPSATHVMSLARFSQGFHEDLMRAVLAEMAWTPAC